MYSTHAVQYNAGRDTESMCVFPDNESKHILMTLSVISKIPGFCPQPGCQPLLLEFLLLASFEPGFVGVQVKYLYSYNDREA